MYDFVVTIGSFLPFFYIVKEHRNNVLNETLLTYHELHSWYIRNEVFSHRTIVKCDICVSNLIIVQNIAGQKILDLYTWDFSAYDI